MSERVYNFNGGPGMIPEAVLEEVQAGMLDWNGTGIGNMELGHRSDKFGTTVRTAVADLRELLEIPEDYEVLFLPGGATAQFSAVPMNLAQPRDSADYVITGYWGKEAMAEGMKFLSHVHVAAKTSPHTSVPDQASWQHSANPAYVHITPNETIDGVAFADIPETDVPLVGDLSSSILSGPLDVTKFGAFYASFPKNIGPAGETLVVVRRDLLERARPIIPKTMDWKTYAINDSMPNTPATVILLAAGLNFKWLKSQGGLKAMAEINARKAAKLYRAIDESELYMNPVAVRNRSLMNVPFTMTVGGLDELFLEQAANEGLVNLEGHRSAGGMRASIYNAMPESGVVALTEFMKAFEEQHA